MATTTASQRVAALPTPPTTSAEIVTLVPTPAIILPPQVTIEIITPTPVLQPPSEAAFTHLHTYTNKDPTYLLDSYATTSTFNDGDTAWAYDNALALLAFLARGEKADLIAARTLADALVFAQTHDPNFDDGRLRDAYHAETFIRSDGRVNVDRGGSATGNMAWAVLALVRGWEQLGDEAYLAAAQRLGQWIVDHTYDERGAGGYTGGLNETGLPFRWKSTEHNVDVYAAFMNLYRATGEPLWRERAMSAKRFLQTMWNEDDGFFWTGTTEDGVSVNPSPIPEDVQSWTLLAQGEPERYGRALNWAEKRLYYDGCPACETINGYRFSDVGAGCWSEGTAHMALAWQAVGETERSETLLQSLRRVRLPEPKSTGEAIPAACGEPAVTGYGWDYPAQVSHLGATAWYLFAELRHNPFWGLPTSEPIPFAGIYDEIAMAGLSPLVSISPEFQKGMNYAAWWQNKYASPASDQALAELAATGTEWLALIVTCYQETYRDTKISCDLPRTPTDEDLIYAIKTAHRLGMQVMLKPHLDLNSDLEHWRGEIGQSFTSADDWRAWFDSYQAVITHYANLAQAQGVEQLCVGTELVGLAQRESDWRQLIASVREIYSGPIVYASNHSGEERRISWWDALDYIGVDAYYPLTKKSDPTVVELKAAWEQPLAALEELHNRYNKPIIVTEIGYRSVDGANRQPWVWTTSGAVDLQEQADSYQAALESLWGQPWLAGIYWWNWDVDPEQGGPRDPGFTPYGKPAELVLQTFYKLETSGP